MADISNTTIANLNGWEAFAHAWTDLYIHLVIAVIIAMVVSFLAILSEQPPDTGDPEEQQPDQLAHEPPDGRAEPHEMLAFRLRFKRYFADYFLYCSAFTIFGLVTAYFLSLGLNPAEASSENALLSAFTTPFISLLTGGVAYVASKTRSGVNQDNFILGVLAFLLACVFSYQTFTKQVFEVKANIRIDAPVQESASEENGLSEVPPARANPEEESADAADEPGAEREPGEGSRARNDSEANGLAPVRPD